MEGKRKRNNNEDDQADVSLVVSWDTLLHPDFEELGRQFPAFRQARQEMEERRQAAIRAVAGKKDPQQRQQSSSASPYHIKHKHLVAWETYLTPTLAWHLTRALLKVHWGLQLLAAAADDDDDDNPSNTTMNLCPPVPNRFYLVDWIQTILLPRSKDAQYYHSDDGNNISENFVGLDIGTGPYSIYPLLWCETAKRRPQQQSTGWHVYGTDVDAAAIETARQNVRANAWEHAITPLVVEPSTAQQQHKEGKNPTASTTTTIESFRGPLQQSLRSIANHMAPHPLPHFTFCLTNPPFFDHDTATTNGGGHSTVDSLQNQQRRDGRDRSPITQSEGFYPGGEVGFIRDIFADQWIMMWRRMTMIPNNTTSTTPPTWTASMCGRKTSWEALVHVLQATLGVAHVQTAEFGPGETVRWFVAWTWQIPVARSPCAACSTWNMDTGGEITVSELTQRLEAYCTWKEDWHLQVVTLNDTPHKQKQEHIHAATTTPLPTRWTLTERPDTIQWHQETDHVAWLPEPIEASMSAWNTVDRARCLLPPEGHFVVDIQATRTTSSSHVVLSCHAYAHTLYGKRRVAQLQSHIGGELTRTNRRWRRKLKLEQHQDTVTEMDTS